MRFNPHRNEYWVSRRDQEAMGEPVGDPHRGPAYGEKTDMGSVISAGINIVGGMMSSDSQSSAASSAAGAQTYNAQLAIAEQQRQFNALRDLLKPYVDVGGVSLNAQKDLIGLNGTSAQQAAIDAISASPAMTALTQKGENAILANASATGNLRGGNTQAALAQFRPQLLAQLMQQQYANLGGLTSLGQNAAAGVGNAGMNSANQIANLYGQIGAAQAGSALAAGKADAGFASGLAGTLGQVAGKFFGGTSSLPGIMF